MKKIELVTTNSDNISIKHTSDSNPEYYLTNVNDSTPLLCNDSNLRVCRSSELNDRLKLRDWNVFNRRFAFNDLNNGNLCMILDDISKGNGIINIIDKTSNNHAVISNDLPTEQDKTDLQNFIINELSSELKEIYDNMSDNEVYLYSITKNVVDILNNSITIDVIPYNSDIYTNTIDLGKLATIYPSPEISIKIDLGVQYSKNVREEQVNDSGEIINIINTEKVFSKETTFSGFKYIINSNGDLEFTNNNYIENVGSDIVIEYVNNIIRVIPKSVEVDECIISNCSITYGKL